MPTRPRLRIMGESRKAAALRLRMEAAAAAMDFEEAGRLRDQLSLLRGVVHDTDFADADTSGLERQRPGAMGLGSSQQRITPPPGWTPPQKPDPMTSGRGRPRRRGPIRTDAD